MKITSTMIIGNVDARFDHLKRGDWDAYMAFYNGWIEGRMQILEEIKRDTLTDPEIIKALASEVKRGSIN
jgi:hypothetical protein